MQGIAQDNVPRYEMVYERSDQIQAKKVMVLLGGERYVRVAETTPKGKCSTKFKHWTLLGLTTFDGSPVVCTVIFSGEKHVPLYETGMDQFGKVEGFVSEGSFLPQWSYLHFQRKGSHIYVPVDTKRFHRR